MLQDVVIANKAYAKLNILDEGAVDEIAVKVIKQDPPEFLLPIKMVNIDGNVEVRYELGSKLRLSYLPETLTKKEFIILLGNMIRPFKICNDWLLDYHHFYLDKKYITVGKNYSGVSYAYIPDSNYEQSEQDILNFFKDFILNTNLTDDQVFVMNLFRRLNDKDASLISILDFISKESDYKEVERKATAPAADSKPLWEAPKAEAPKAQASKAEVPKAETTRQEVTKSATPEKEEKKEEFGKKDMKNSLINNLFGDADEEEEPKKEKKDKKYKKDTEKKGFLGGFISRKEKEEKVTEKPAESTKEVKQAKAETVEPVTYAQPVDNSEDVTFIDGEDEAAVTGDTLVLTLEYDGGYQFPKYIEIDLSKGYATVGRYDKAGQKRADYNFDKSLSFISKTHFRIEKKDNQLTIIDMKSSNGTFLNGEELVEYMPYQLSPGDRIVLARKERITYRVG